MSNPFSNWKTLQGQVVYNVNHVVDIDTCHILLRRLWKYNRDDIYKCKNNVYIIIKMARKSLLHRQGGTNQIKASKVWKKSLLNLGNIMKE